MAMLALETIYGGTCGQHLGGRMLAHKILRQTFYWTYMKKEALEFVKKCERFHKYTLLVHKPPDLLASITTPLPFSVWGMDILGPFPMGSGQRKLLVVAINYFTKYIEAKPLAQITTSKIKKNVWEDIICMLVKGFKCAKYAE